MISSYADILGGRIHYEAYGPAATSARDVFICLHGNSSSGRVFRPLLRGLPDDIHVVCVDFPGHGRSDRAEHFREYYSFQGLSEVLLSFIESLNLAPTGIIGHSMGGHIAVQAAPKIKSLSRLVLISSPPIAGAEAIPRFFRSGAPLDSIFAEALTPLEIDNLAVAFSSAGAPATVLQALKDDIASTDGAFRAELGRSLQGKDVIDEAAILKSLRGVDALLVGGDADAFVNPRYYSAIRAEVSLQDEESKILPNIGHYPHLEAPYETAGIIAAWLRGKPAAAAAASV